MKLATISSQTSGHWDAYSMRYFMGQGYRCESAAIVYINPYAH